MVAVVDDARMRAGDGHAVWSESFSEMYAQVAGLWGTPPYALVRLETPPPGRCPQIAPRPPSQKLLGAVVY